jgi:hypothetical protein
MSAGSRCKFLDFDLHAGLGGVFRGSQNLPADFFRNVRLAAIVAHFCRDGLEDESGAFALDSDAGATGSSVPHPADDALHCFLLLKSASQSAASGS